MHGWKFDRASIRFPAPVRNRRIAKDPKHLGKGWAGFNFARPLGIPVRIINDAALRALGSYHGGRMFFLGLGTGLGSALLWDKTVMPLELGDLSYREKYIIENYLGIPGLELFWEKNGSGKWLALPAEKSVYCRLCRPWGGLVHRFKRLPEGAERGKNENAFLGGIRLWKTNKRSHELKWRVL